MKKRLLKTMFMTLALAIPCISVQAQKYVIYPIPRSITMNDGTLTVTEKVNVVCESTIDEITQTRLKNIMSEHGIEVVPNGTNAEYTTVYLGTVGSGEQVETMALNEIGLKKASIMTSKKFDRHAISISEHGIVILGEHTNAVFFGLASLEQIMEQQSSGALEYTTIYDRADQQNRGLVEGYYGYPYSVSVKKDLMRYMMRFKMNTYLYGAKSDPYHSQKWKEAYPATITEQQEKNGWLTQEMVSEIAKVSEETKVNFIWAIHPGNEFLGSSTVVNDIIKKFELMHNLGVRHFGVFVDDVSIPSSDSDMTLNANRLTTLQKSIEEKWNYEGAAAGDTVRPLHFVPQIYCSSFASSEDQRKRFMSALSKVPKHITVYTTGQGVWSVPNNNHTTTIVNEFGRAMGWWWNYPCNDNADGQLYPMDMYGNFVDMPSIGNNERLPSTLNNCQGIVANPMQQGEVAKTSLFSIADYAWNNAGFKNESSWEASFKSIIENEEIRQAYHDITYYLRWNDPQSIQTLINNYKTSLENGSPNATKLLEEIAKIKNNCEKVITLKDSETESDRLLYNDIRPWLHTLHTYSIIIEKMIGILANPVEGHNENWLAVKEVSDSLASLQENTLYTAYALEGMGNGISVSQRQAQLSRNYIYPFISYLRERAIDHYFDDPTAIKVPTAITNSSLVNATVDSNGGVVSIIVPTCNLDIDKYVGVVLPAPTLIDKITIDESLIPLAKYSTDGKIWKPLAENGDAPQEHVGYFIFMNDSEKGIKDFSLPEGAISLVTATQAIPQSVTIPDGSIYDNHDSSKFVDGNYNTYTCLNRNQKNGDRYVLDLGTEVILHDVRLCMGTVNGDHPTTACMQYSADGTKWNNIKIKDLNGYNWNINLKQNVKYSDEMVYCDFDGAGKTARYVRLSLTSANTSKWMRLYEIEVNRQHGENGTLPECSDGNGKTIAELTDANAKTGIATTAPTPLTYTFNRHYDIKGVTIYSLPTSTQPAISVSNDNIEWTAIGSINEPCQWVDLQEYPKARALRLEWQSNEAPAIFEIMPLYDLNTSSLPGESSGTALDFALLKSKAIHALDSCGQGNKLVTSSSQFSSPYTEPNEGSINNLLDGKQNTIWHSKWSSGDVKDGIHYIEIALPAETINDVIMHFGRRSDNEYNQLIKARILGVVSGEGTSATTEVIADLDMPYTSPKETVVKRFTLTKSYPAIRLQQLKNTNETKAGASGYFHIGELQFYSTLNYYIIKDAQAEADALIAAMEPMPSEATEEDLNNLQKAYDAFMYKVFGIIPSGIDDVKDNNGKNIWHDLSGRRIAKPTKAGIYIMNGKKMLVK